MLCVNIFMVENILRLSKCLICRLGVQLSGVKYFFLLLLDGKQLQLVNFQRVAYILVFST